MIYDSGQYEVHDIAAFDKDLGQRVLFSKRMTWRVNTAYLLYPCYLLIFICTSQKWQHWFAGAVCTLLIQELFVRIFSFFEELVEWLRFNRYAIQQAQERIDANQALLLEIANKLDVAADGGK